jgi:sulfotransferase
VKKICFVGGLPRSGSTLLCNILNQNPRFYASGTSPLPHMLGAVKKSWDKSLDVLSQIDQEKDHYFNRFAAVLRGITEAWYQDIDAEVIFDKSRPWNAHYLLLKQLYENPRMILCVRDLRSVFASIEKHYLESMLYGSLLHQTINNKLKEVFDGKGVIGNQLMYMMDLHERGLFSEILVIKYEVFTREPKETMDRLYEYVGEEPYEHDFDHVVRTTQENDGVYRYHYPHRGEGKVTPAEPNDWQGIIPEKAARIIRKQHDPFFRAFGYD